MANSQQTVVLPGSGARQIVERLLTESGDQLLLENGLGFLGLESGGAFSVQSTAIDGLSDYAVTIPLVEGFTLVADVNSQQDVVLVDYAQTVKLDEGLSNSQQTVRVT
jgi:hypothetical protein